MIIFLIGADKKQTKPIRKIKKSRSGKVSLLPVGKSFRKFATAVHGAPLLIFVIMETVNTTPVTPPAFILLRDTIRAEHPHFYEFWTINDMNRVREYFLGGMRIEAIADATGRTPQGIRKKLMGMGEIVCARGREGQPWTYDEEIRLNRMLTQGYSVGELTRLIGRKKKEIQSHIMEMELYSE